jgi:hypothetical protein
MRGMRLRWGNLATAVDAAGETSGSVVEAILLFAYLIAWSLVMAAYIAVFVLASAVTSLLVLVWLPCFLWSKVLPKVQPQRSGHGPKPGLSR